MYPKPYIEYLAHFHGTRDYFECHEVLEEHWKKVDANNRSSIWVLFIQIAVAMYHDRQGNQNGALTLMKRCLVKSRYHQEGLYQLGLDGVHLHNQIQENYRRLNDGLPYRSWNMPVIDLELRKEVQLLCQHWNVAYGSPSDLSKKSLVYKHKMRKQ
ncbi:DUF309 domain-containing protein [Halobacillus karajensis]|uniref:DUF309 domain-containing protein n=1 Tax=Halobacillus karajensis TaxID=195088 RepID=A0A024P2S1_9BACI|nr:DUF309 domain-containing protein [Halobacillus karajensis]CDQ19445.1 hypothetical protein BN982_01739 [Halobacillus karajensis]CDQ21907.1 hypothetical protein BN983_00102 [Halobacillus karajensis]CDQ27748.1 hypothetical protein BN981_02029 [Halobacillus karajensis]